jgi:hypothetical protein
MQRRRFSKAPLASSMHTVVLVMSLLRGKQMALLQHMVECSCGVHVAVCPPCMPVSVLAHHATALTKSASDGGAVCVAPLTAVACFYSAVSACC